MKYQGQLRGILHCGFAGFGLGLALCALMGFSPEKSLILALAGLWGGLLGALTAGKSNAVAGTLFGLSVLGGVVLGVLGFHATTSVMVTAIVSGLSAGALIVGGYGFYGPLGCWSVVISALGLWASGLTGTCSVYWRCAALAVMVLGLILAVDGFREKSMRSAQLRDRHSPGVGDPGHILGYNYLLVGIFLVLALTLGVLTMGLGEKLVQGTKSVASGSTSGIGKVLNWIVWAITAILEWIRSLVHAPKNSPGEGFGESDYTRPVYFGGLGSWLTTVIFVLAMVAVAVTVTGMVGAVLLRARKKGKPVEEILDYIDEVEQLERPKGLFRRKKGRGKQRFQDFEDPALKIRFTFQQLLKKKRETDPVAYAKTPNELRDADIPDEAAVVGAYNRVKYARGGVSQEELAAAERYLQYLK